MREVVQDSERVLLAGSTVFFHDGTLETSVQAAFADQTPLTLEVSVLALAAFLEISESILGA